MKRLLITGAAAGLALAASLIGGTAHATQPVLNGSWQTVVLHAYSGGGCAGDQFQTAEGSVFYSEGCDGLSDQDVSMRELNNDTDFEVAEPSLGLALTISGGQWIWGPANDNTTVFPIGTGTFFNGGEFFIFHQAGDHYMEPNGNFEALRDLTPTGTLSSAGWDWQSP